jgi:hypothetical protein
MVLLPVYIIINVFQKIQIPSAIQLLLCLALFFKCIVFPQFTINSGICAVAGILYYLVARIEDSFAKKIVAMIMLWMSYSIRAEMFYLIMILSIPIVLYDRQVGDGMRKLGIDLCLLIVGIVLIKSIDNYVNQGSEYVSFYKFQSLRVALIDFNGLNHLSSWGCFTKNDIELMKNWFFEFLDLNDLSCLNSSVNAININIKDKLNAIKNAFKALADKEILPYTLVSFLYLVKDKSIYQRATLVLVLLAISVMGVLERGGQSRVYIPMLISLTIYSIYLAKVGNEKN